MSVQGRIAEAGAVPVAWREPFSLKAPYRDVRRQGETIHDIVASVPGLPLGFPERGVVCINGEVIPQASWKLVKPKANSPMQPVAVTLHWPLQDGGGGQGGNAGKSIIALVGAIALTAITGGIAAGALAGVLGSGFAAGTFGAAALSAAVGLAGALAITALTAPPTVRAQSELPGAEQKGAASAEGNVVNPGGAIPRVLGTRRVFPPLVGDPIIEIIDDDQYVEACFALNGPHLLEDIRLGDAPLEEAEDVESETREGWDDDTPVTLTARQGKQQALNVQMSSHTVDPTTQNNLKDPTDPDVDLPVFHAFSSKKSPDEIWLHLALPAGLGKQSDPTDDKSIPFRIRGRLRGSSTWINFPEIHLSERTTSQVRVAIKFLWETYPGVIPAIPTQSSFVYASIAVPGQAVLPATSGWTANAYFSDGAGSDYLQAGVEASSKVTNTLLYDNRVEFYLDEVTFPKGVYDFEIKRGSAYDTSSFTGSAYTYSGTVRDFFTYYDTTTPQIPLSRLDIADAVGLDLLQSIWNEHPVPVTGFALIAIRALNRRVEALSVLASGYVPDWDGSAWTDWTTTSFPAAHYADVLSGRLNKDPLPADIRDDTGLVAWRTKCISNNWTADIIVEDMRTEDALTLLASCGYARPYQSEQYGVAVDDDHSADDIVQVFSPRNIRSFRSEKAFAHLPDGFIVTYRDVELNYEDAETIVYAEGYSGGDGGRLEAVSYDGLVDRVKVRTRAKFDLDQADQRSAFYYLDADMESIVCRKGDLVVVQHDSIDNRAGFALIKSLLTAGPNITGIVLDSQIPVTNELDMHAVTDMHSVVDMHEVGVTTGIAIRHDDGTVSTHEISDATGDTDTCTLVTPIPTDATIRALATSDQIYGSMVVSGRLTAEYLRLLVAAIQPAKDGVFSLTLVDEAPDLIRSIGTILLVHFDGTAGSIAFADDSLYGHTLTAGANAQVDTAQKKFGSASGLFDGTGDYILTNTGAHGATRTGGFGIEFWLRLAGNQTERALFGNRRDPIGSAAEWLVKIGGTNNCISFHTGAAAIFDNAANPLSNNTWYHIALTATGTQLLFFIDGVLISTSAFTNNLSSDEDFSIAGGDVFVAGSLNGWIDDLRFGIPRYTAAFTPPAAALTAD